MRKQKRIYYNKIRKNVTFIYKRYDFNYRRERLAYLNNVKQQLAMKNWTKKEIDKFLSPLKRKNLKTTTFIKKLNDIKYQSKDAIRFGASGFFQVIKKPDREFIRSFSHISPDLDAQTQSGLYNLLHYEDGSFRSPSTYHNPTDSELFEMSKVFGPTIRRIYNEYNIGNLSYVKQSYLDWYIRFKEECADQLNIPGYMSDGAFSELVNMIIGDSVL